MPMNVAYSTKWPLIEQSVHNRYQAVKKKERVTALVCYNTDGSKKFELMLIDIAQCPSPFKKNMAMIMGWIIISIRRLR